MLLGPTVASVAVICLQAVDDGEQFLQSFHLWEEPTESGLDLATEGARQGLKDLRGSITDTAQATKACAALMIEEVVIKAYGYPETEPRGLCSKMTQWIAGSKWGVMEEDLHPTLATFGREHS